MPVVFLNHDFVSGIAHRDDLGGVLVELANTLRRLGVEPIHVHSGLHAQETGQGPFIAYANRQRSNPDRRRIIELLLRLCQGPFVTDLPVDIGEPPKVAEPALPIEPTWRVDAIFHFGHHGLASAGSSMDSIV